MRCQLLSLVALLGGAVAQQFPQPVAYDQVVTINPNVSLSYKQPAPGTCTTVFSTQKQYTGYIHLSPATIDPQQNYTSNTFFWFFEARTNAEHAPLTIWLNGGPGSSSMIGLFQEIGPCEVVQLKDGSYGTQPRLWGWDRTSNLLFIDQPTQVGFSYDEAVNASLDLGNSDVFGDRQPPQYLPESTPSWRFHNGTFASGNNSNTQNSTLSAARAFWPALQGFLSAFPQYDPNNRTDDTSAGVHLFAESYGGQYAPTFADYILQQNGTFKLTSVGIVNGMVDASIQTQAIADYLRSNSYGIQAIPDVTDYQNAVTLSKKNCTDLIAQCRSGNSVSDSRADDTCASASDACLTLMADTMGRTGKSEYDIRASNLSGPSLAYMEYLNDAGVLRSIGATVNYTQSNNAINRLFIESGDLARGDQLKPLARLLGQGVRVAFIYGDADISCNWLGGEKVSLELARRTTTYSTFSTAGYAAIIPNSTYVGGQVRQLGNLSFSRIYDAGHLVPLDQAETAFTVYARIISGDDIGMGKNIDINTFRTEGPSSADHANKVPKEQPRPTCWIRALNDTCSEEQKSAIRRGEGSVDAGVWVEMGEEAPEPTSVPPGVGRPGSLPPSAPTNSAPEGTASSSIPVTGVYTATATPTSAAPRLRPPLYDLMMAFW